jgi:TonB family protein
VHGHIQPSNILAVGDQVKVSSDALRALSDKNLGAGATSAYDPPEATTGTVSKPGDSWQVGMTVIEVLTQRLPVWDRAQTSAPEVPEAVPEPFRDIAEGCLQVNAGKRWTVGQILGRLGAERQGTKMVEPVRPGPTSVQPDAQTEKAASPPAVLSRAISSRQNESAKRRYLLLLVVAVVVALVLFARRKSSSAPSEDQSTQAQQASTQQEPTPGSGGNGNAASNSDNSAEIIKRVIPEVSPEARRTIQGKIKVRVEVKVDNAGNVEKAILGSGRVSKYFSRIALEAAREWKFSPASGVGQGREWRLEFAFSTAKTEASAVRAQR